MVGNAQIIANHMDNSSQEPTTAGTDSGEATESTPLLPEQRSAFGTIVLTLLCILFAVGLVCGIYLILKEDGKLDPLPGKLIIVPKTDWGSNETTQKYQNLSLPALHILLLQSNGSTCYDEETCSTEMRAIQTYHMNNLKESSIMPNFMVGGDGRTYEGCGWTCKSDYTINNETLTVGLLGAFQDRPPTELQVSQIVTLIDYAIAEEKLLPCYTVAVHMEPGNEAFSFLIAVAEVLRKRTICRKEG